MKGKRGPRPGVNRKPKTKRFATAKAKAKFQQRPHGRPRPHGTPQPVRKPPRRSWRYCTAHARSGKRCRRPAIRGGTVCHIHGGGAPQVKLAARVRLAALVDPAIDELARLLTARNNPRVRLGACKDVLDRNGYKAPDQVQLSGDVGGEFKVIFVDAEAGDDGHGAGG